MHCDDQMSSLVYSDDYKLEVRRKLSKAKFVPAHATVMSAPSLIAAGVRVPARYKDNWTKGMNSAWFSTPEPRSGVRLKVVVFYNNSLDYDRAMRVFKQIQHFVGQFRSKFTFEERPYDMLDFRQSEGMHFLFALFLCVLLANDHAHRGF